MQLDNNAIKTLFITSDASAMAGVGPCLADALEHIDRNLINPIVICPWEAQGAATILPRLEALALPVYTRNLGKWMPSPDRWGLSHLLSFVSTLKERVWALSSLIEREGIEVVYSNGLPCIDGALAALLSHRPHIWHLHEAIRNNPDLRQYIPAWLVQRLVARLSTTIIVNSSYLAREFDSAGRLKPLRVVHNGVNVSQFSQLLVSEAALSVRQEFELSPDTLIVLAVGTANPRKGYDILIKAAASVLSKQSGVCFLVAGSELTDYSKYLRDLAIDLGLGQAFRFLGPRQDIPRLMAACDIFVHCARQETFGRALIEAMAAGKPVVSTRCGGPEEIVEDGETGYLVPVDNSVVFAERIIELLQSPHRRNNFGKAGQSRAIKYFSVTHYASSIQKIILATAGHRKSL